MNGQFARHDGISRPNHTTKKDRIMELIEQLQWRYATKKMDPAKPVSQDKVERILELFATPTSSGLQPYEVLVVTNKAIREQIKPIAWNQSQITDSSHLLGCFAACRRTRPERIYHIFDLTAKERGGTNADWKPIVPA